MLRISFIKAMLNRAAFLGNQVRHEIVEGDCFVCIAFEVMRNRDGYLEVARQSGFLAEAEGRFLVLAVTEDELNWAIAYAET